MTYHGPETRSRIPGFKHHGIYHGYHAASYHGFPLSFMERGTVEVERGLPMRHQDMLTRFRTIPKNGTTLETPLIGWRYEWTDGRKLWNFPPGVHASPAPCAHQPSGFAGMFAYASPTHAAPHPGCTCGLRVVGHLEVLSTYASKLRLFTDAVGLDIDRPLEATGRVVCKVKVTGYVTPAVPDWTVDPPFCVRAGEVELLEVYAPAYLDADRLQSHGVPVRPLRDLPRGLFTELHAPEPDPALSIEAKGDQARIMLGIGPVVIPREALRGTEIFHAVTGLAYRRNKGSNLTTVIERLVKPYRPDITTLAHQQAAAFGIALMLTIMAEGRTTT